MDGQRNHYQVLSNSCGGVVAALVAQLAPRLASDQQQAETIQFVAAVAFLVRSIQV